MNEKPRIFIIDDSTNDIQLLLSELHADYQVNAATSAEEAMKTLSADVDLILLDVNMPNMNGYEACRMFKADPVLKDIDIIFLSSNDKTEEIIEGLDAGAIDYIVKPYNPNILQSKIKAALDNQGIKRGLLEQVDSANQMAYTMMSESGRVSSVLNFFRKSFEIENPKELALSTSKTLAEHALNNAVYLVTDTIDEIESHLGKPSMLEIELLKRLHNYPSPFLEKGQRCFVMTDHCVVLIKNMPSEEDKRGSLKDFIKLLLEGTNSKVSHFDDINKAASKNLGKLEKIITESKTKLSELKETQQEHKRESVLIMDEMVNEVENSFLFLGLTEEQESKIVNIMTHAVDRLLNHVDAGLSMDESITNIVTRLGSAAESVVLKKSATKKSQEEVEPA